MVDRSSLRWMMFGVLLAACVGYVFPAGLPWAAAGAMIGLGYDVWTIFRGRRTRNTHERLFEQLRKKRLRAEKRKHRHIYDQIAYISKAWGYSKEQEKIIDRFLETRAYGEIYNRLTASLLPQMISLIDNCNSRDRRGCKRDVSRRLKVLTDLMKHQTRKQRSQKHESFETTLEVYDRLLTESGG